MMKNRLKQPKNRLKRNVVVLNREQVDQNYHARTPHTRFARSVSELRLPVTSIRIPRWLMGYILAVKRA
jgi:hypothetical protein